MEGMIRNTSRRAFLGSVTSAAAIISARPSLAAAPGRPGSVRLGLCTYSLFKTKFPEVVEAAKTLRLRYINIKPEAHLPIGSTPAQIAEVVKMLDDAGLQLVGTGTTYLQKEDEGQIRQAFEYNQALKSPLIVIGPTARTLPIIEKFVKEYNIKVAVHNHGPSDKHFPTPASALALIKGMDPRVGVCMDIGHTMRAGVDPAAAAKEAGARLLDMHTKDVHQMNGKWDGVDCGDGDINLPALFRQLQKMSYSGYCNLEYEVKTDEKIQRMAKSIAYMRGVLAGMAQSA
jgi:sugar phosphate isomerase/epimerase